MSRDRVISDINFERIRQDNLWGVQDHDDLTWITILAEEFGEVAKARLDYGENSTQLRTELVQTAAVCVAWLEAIGRRGENLDRPQPPSQQPS